MNNNISYGEIIDNGCKQWKHEVKHIKWRFYPPYEQSDLHSKFLTLIIEISDAIRNSH